RRRTNASPRTPGATVAYAGRHRHDRSAPGQESCAAVGNACRRAVLHAGRQRTGRSTEPRWPPRRGHVWSQTSGTTMSPWAMSVDVRGRNARGASARTEPRRVSPATAGAGCRRRSTSAARCRTWPRTTARLGCCHRSWVVQQIHWHSPMKLRAQLDAAATLLDDGAASSAVRMLRSSWEPELPPQDLVPLYCMWIRALCETDDLDHALTLALRAADEFPREPDILIALGNVHDLRGELEPARDAFYRAIEAEPNGPLQHYNLGAV